MLRVRLQKLGSLLGLLAILMTVLAPTVSQVLASHHRLSDALASYCTAEVAPDLSGHDGKAPHSAARHWQACPYCNLLAHAPTLPATAAPLAVTLSVARATVPQARAEVRVVYVHTSAQPRAPPVFS